MQCKTIGLDLAKNSFQVCGVGEHSTPIFNRKLKRNQLVPFFAQQTPTTVVMEACYSAHYWGRELVKLGHHTKLIPAQHVTPFVRGNKNDHNDALAIAEASQRPHVRFVPVKTEYQQEILSLHRVRERLQRNRTSLVNQTRGILSEFGVIAPVGVKHLRAKLAHVIGDTSCSQGLRNIVANAYVELLDTEQRIEDIEQRLKAFLDEHPCRDIIMSLPGVGLINASAFLASIDKGQAFHSPREFSVWLGLTPQLFASGDSHRMGGITKRGDRYLRTLLVHGARAALSRSRNKTDALSVWGNQLVHRRGYNKAVVAFAHRLARLMWILLQRNECYQPQPALEVYQG
nr:IS110 family transposase [Enterovibrio norvegicus]PMH67766.1 transposase [Enterovibrio norvegicus]